MQRKGLFLIQTIQLFAEEILNNGHAHKMKTNSGFQLGTTHNRSSKEMHCRTLSWSVFERYVWYGGDALFIKVNFGWNAEIVRWKGKCNEWVIGTEKFVYLLFLLLFPRTYTRNCLSCLATFWVAPFYGATRRFAYLMSFIGSCTSGLGLWLNPSDLAEYLCKGKLF